MLIMALNITNTCLRILNLELQYQEQDLLMISP